MRYQDTVGISQKLKNAENLLVKVIDSELSKLGISLAQYSALAALEIKATQTNAELARQCEVTPQTMNKIMNGLFTHKLVKKSADETHGLKLNFELTPRAVKLICEAHEKVNAIELQCLKGLSSSLQKDFQKSLDLVIENLKK